MPKQTCWLDVLKQGHLNSVEILEACAAIQFPSDLFRVDKASKTRYQLLLRLYQQSGQSQDIILLWDPAKTPNLSIKDT